MSNIKSIKRALICSIIAFALCFTMLLGTTFAWFTDSVTSSNNIIKAGTLEVTMDWADGKADPSSVTWTDASTGAIFNNDKWEPGYTEVRHIKVTNAGTLALKYQFHVVANGTVSELANVIDVYYVDPAAQITDRADLTDDMKIGTLADVLAGFTSTASGNLVAGEAHTVSFALVMQESAGNEYQGKSIGASFSIQLYATQLTSESDSFDNQYDAMATVETIDELNAALAADYNLITLGANIEVADSIKIPADKEVTIDLCGYTLSQIKDDVSASHAFIDVKGMLTIENSIGDGKISFVDATPYTSDIGWASNTIRNDGVVIVNGGTIENLSSANVADFGYPHAIDCYQDSVTVVNGGTVKSANYDAIRMFCNSTTLATEVVINGGTIVNRVSFQSPNNFRCYGILEINGGNFVTTDGVKGNVRLLNFSTDISNMKATVNGGTFDKGIYTQNHANCTIKTSDWLTVGNSVAVSTADELSAALANGGEIILVADIAVADKTFNVPSGKNVTLYMNGRTISGTFNNTSDTNKCLFSVNKASLTIDGEGVITMNTTGKDMAWNAMSCTICANGGDLTVNGTTIKNEGGTRMAYAIDTNPWNDSSNSVLDVVLNDAKVESTYFGIRVRDNGPYFVKVVANDSEIDDIWYQEYSSGNNVNTGNYGTLVEIILNNTTADTTYVNADVLTIQ